MLDRMHRLKKAITQQSRATSRLRDARSLRAANLRGAIEKLEERVVLAVDTWTPLTGGIWEQGTNWSLGHAPAAGDDAVIFPTDASGNPIGSGTVTFNDPTDAANSITLSPTFSLQFNAATFALGAGTTVLNGTGANVTIVSGATVSVAPSASFTLVGSTITDKGTLSFAAGDSVGLESKGGTAQITVANGGVLAANTAVGTAAPAAIGVTFSTLPVPGTTPTPPTSITINSGGHLTGTNNVFGDTDTTLSDGTVLNNGDLTGNDFSGTDLILPVIDVPLVTNNTKFTRVDLLGGTLSTGNTVSLTAMGTAQKLTGYRFVGSYTVNPGATLNLDPSLGLYNLNNTLTVDGALNFGSGDSVELFNANYVVNGQMTATGTSFYNDPGIAPPTNAPASGPTSLVINSGGHLIGSGNSFGFTTTTLNVGSILNSGDLTNNNFNVTFQPNNPVGAAATVSILALPLIDIPLMTSNTSFSQVDILGSTLTTGQTVALTQMGTAGSPNLLYVLVGNSTINAGAALTVNSNLKLNIAGVTLADNGTLTFNSGDLVTFTAGGAAIAVGGGGVMTTTSTTFVNTPGVTGSSISVASGGHLTGTGNNIAPSATSINAGAILNSGDLTGNNFANTVLALPATDVPLVTNNTQFAEVDLIAGTVPAGTNVTLTAMGTTSSITLFYVFAGALTIAGPSTTGTTTTPAATLTINPKLTVIDDAPVTVNGTLTVGSGDAVTLNGGSFTVGSGGTMNVDEAAIANGNGGTGTIADNMGGTLTIVGSSIAPSSLTIGPNSMASLTLSTFAGALTVDSSATLDDGTTPIQIGGNNLAMISGVTATGAMGTQINMTGNYWGTTSTAAIAAKITDATTNSSLPKINYLPIVSGVAGVAAGNVTVGYSGAVQNVTIQAAVTGVTGTINEGSVTFGVYNGSTLIGTALSANVAGGLASVTYALPAGTAQGQYTIQAQFSDGTLDDYLPAIDTSHSLTVTRAATTVTAPAAGVSATYNANNNQVIALTATVASAAGGVNEGTATFTVLNGTTVVGTPVTVNVSNGTATGSYALLAGTKGGTYTVSVVFNGSTNYTASTAATFPLVVKAAASTTAATAATATFSTASQTVTVKATVTSPAGTVNEGAVTFTLLNGTTAVGTAVTINVANGVATGSYTLPAGTAAGTYTISAAYNGTVDYAASTNATQSLTVGKVATTTTPAAATTPYNTASSTVTLTATVAGGTGAVNEGSVTFTVLNGTTVVGTATTGVVVAGVATVTYTLPGGIPVGTSYTIQASYAGSTDYQASSGAGTGTGAGAGKVVIVQATPTVAGSTDAGVYNPTTETIGVHATVLNGTTGVTEGSVTFQAMSGTTAVGSPVTVNVATGAANGTLALPGLTVGTTDTVLITFNGTANYAAATASATISLTKATPTVTFNAPASIVFGTPLSAAQLDATASVPGTFLYSPAAGVVLPAGSNQVLAAVFTPTDTTDYNTATAATQVTVTSAAPTFSSLAASQTIAYGQATITASGTLAAGTTIPAGSSVAITVGSIAATAVVGSNGTFSVAVPVATLPVGTYPITYTFVGTANFASATNAATALTVVKANQTIATFSPPASATYGTTFHLNVASTSGLPVTLTATNAIVVAVATGGYNITPTSGTNNVVLTASQPGDANHTAAAVVSATITATKAQATVVLPNLGIFYDGNAHTVTAQTNPAGLAVAVTYTLNGQAVAQPIGVGAYVATATINDANFQGTATSSVVIVASAVATTPVVGPVALEYIQIPTRTSAGISKIALTFSGALNASTAVALGNYRLATAGKGGSYDAKGAATIKIKSAVYNAATHTVTLTVAKPFKLTKAVELRVYGTPGHAVTDVYGNPIDGTHSGIAGSNENAILSKNGITT